VIDNIIKPFFSLFSVFNVTVVVNLVSSLLQTV